MNAASTDFIMICFATVAGFSAFGTFEGTGTSDPKPFISLGFKPAFIMFKNLDATGSWAMYDTARDSIGNPVDNTLIANDDAVEVTDSSDDFDFISNGIKIRSSWAAVNGSSNTIVYAAFAEHPFAGTTPATAR